MKRMGGFVNSSIKSLKAGKAIELHRLKSDWLNAVGPFLSSQTEPISLKGNILYLRVSSPIWAQEIHLQQRLVIENLAKRMKHPPKKIVCWVGEVHQKAERPISGDGPGQEEEKVPWSELAIPEERLARIQETLSTIDDPGLQKKMKKLMELSVRRELYLLAQGQLPCPLCGNFRSPEESICENCRRERKEERERAVLRLLAREPWLTARDVAERLPLKDKATYMRLRKTLLANWMLDAWQRTSGLTGEELDRVIDQDLRTLLLDITMLRCSVPIHALQARHFYFALGKRLASAYLSDQSSTEESH